MTTQIVPYLFFDRTCRAAMEFYQSALGGELKITALKDTPVAAQFPPEAADLVMHADLRNGVIALMASDSFDGSPVNSGNTISLMINCSSEGELRGYFEALSKGGKVDQPVRQEFWGDIYGQLTDKFGMQWMMNFHPEN
jgi:PhnB protein